MEIHAALKVERKWLCGIDCSLDFGSKKSLTISFGTARMPPKIPKVNDFLISRGAEAPSERESANQANRSASWSHRRITDMPREVLSIIFNRLGPDDITQVKDTCRVFREVVQERYREIFFLPPFIAEVQESVSTFPAMAETVGEKWLAPVRHRFAQQRERCL